MHFSKSRIFWTFLLLSLLLAACQNRTTTPNPGPNPTLPEPAQTATLGEAPPPATAAPTASPTPEPPRTLVLCTQEEPRSLYVYGGSSRSMWSVLEAIYDGPFDTRAFSIQPVILQKIPSLAEGDAQLRPVTVRAGEAVVNVDGNLVALKSGVQVLPSGCSQPGCAISWDGQSELVMDQLVVRFQLLPGLAWSDGQPLTAADSVFSYRLAADPATPSSKYVTDRTAAYTAPDAQTAEWSGLPGFFDQRYGTFFFLPLPEHALGAKTAAELLADERANRAPLGWGPYVIQEWKAGDHITLVKNPRYFRAAEGLPKFDTLVYRFVGDTADANMNALLAGECDVVDQNPQMLEMLPGLIERENARKLVLHLGQGPEWEHLNFGIRPASYDDGYQPGAGDRPDLFGDARTRQAFAMCIDRLGIINEHLHRRSVVPNSFLPPDHPDYQPDLPQYAYDPAAGAQLLDQVGWKDDDADPATPRVAAGVAGVPDGTRLAVSYFTTQAALRVRVAQSVASALGACGVQVNLSPASPSELFAPGPQGLVFGRQFDLVQFSWEAGPRPGCLLYASSQVPGPSNQWIGANVTGYSSPAFDAACATASWSRGGAAENPAPYRAVQDQFARDLPAIPLYFYPKIAISRPDLCWLGMDVSARSIFWNLEVLDYGNNCVVN